MKTSNAVKRVSAVLLSVIMLISLLAPTTVLAAGTVRDDEDELETLDLVICRGIEPRIDRNPVMSVIPAWADRYDARLLYFYRDTAGYPHLDADDVFEDGETYLCRVDFTAKDGYVFSEDTVFLFNDAITGNQVGSNASMTEVIMEFAFTPKDMTVYAVGAGQGSWLNGVSWDPADDSNLMTEVSDNVWEIEYHNVDADFDYQVKFALNGRWSENFGMSDDEGYWSSIDTGIRYDAVLNGWNISFDVDDDESDVKLRLDLNGMYDNVFDGGSFTVIVNGEVAPTVIDEIRIDGFREPKVGDKAHDYLNVAVPRGKGYKLTDVCWRDATVGLKLDDDQTFIDGHEYYIDVKIALMDGFSFGKDVKYYINGSSALVDTEYCYHDAAGATVYSINIKLSDSRLPGDVDGNGIVENADLVLLARYVVKISGTLPHIENAYMNNDTLIDNVDLVILARKIVGLA